MTLGSLDNIDESRSPFEFTIERSPSSYIQNNMVSSSLVEGFQSLATEERSLPERDLDVGSLFNSVAPIVASDPDRIRTRLSRYGASESLKGTKTTSELSKLPHHLKVLNSKIANPGRYS